MKLSAAIRIGSLVTQQIIGQFSDRKNGRCAIGAAAEAVNIDLYTDFDDLFKLFPILLKKLDSKKMNLKFPLPKFLTLFQLIPYLNDSERWSREVIADFVESIEEKEELANGNLSPNELQISNR